MGGNVRLVQRGGMKYRFYTHHTTPDVSAVGYRPDVSGKRAIEDVEANNVVF